MNNFYKTTVKLFLVAILLGIGVRLAAQDLLVFTDGSIEQVKVLEVGDDAIKYKKWANLDGPTFSTSKANVFSIKYQDGSEEKMVNQQVRPGAPNQPYQPRQNTGGGGYQQTKDGGFSIHFGGAFPVGDFGEETHAYIYYDEVLVDFDRGFSASPGFNIGIKGKIPLPVNGLGIFISGDFIFNGVKGTLKEDYDELQEIIEDYGGSFTRPRYINVPLLVGINYKYSVNQHFGVWAETGVGANLRMITAMKAELDGSTATIKFPIRPCVAFQIGGGIMINDLFSVGLHYYALGSSKMKMKYEYKDDWGSDSDTYTTTKSYSQACFMLRLGFHF